MNDDISNIKNILNCLLEEGVQDLSFQEAEIMFEKYNLTRIQKILIRSLDIKKLKEIGVDEYFSAHEYVYKHIKEKDLYIFKSCQDEDIIRKHKN